MIKTRKAASGRGHFFAVTIFSLVFAAVFVLASQPVLAYIDIGLRFRTSSGPVGISASANLADSPLRIRKNGQTYAVILVPTNDPYASPAHITLPGGIVKALRKLGDAPPPPPPPAYLALPDQFQSVILTGCSGSRGTWAAPITIVNNTSLDALLTIQPGWTQQSGVQNPPSSFTVQANSSRTVGFGRTTQSCEYTTTHASGSATYSVTQDGAVRDYVTYSWEDLN